MLTVLFATNNRYLVDPGIQVSLNLMYLTLFLIVLQCKMIN